MDVIGILEISAGFVIYYLIVRFGPTIERWYCGHCGPARKK